ncbi:MAG: PepSY1/2 domain-containing protein [Lachnospiraceae bacterium]
MKLGKSITIITTGMLFAAVIAGHGSMGAAAAESTTADYAVSIALSDAGLSEDEVTIEETEKGSVQGASVYEIAFWTDSKEYEYDIAVADGEIVKVSWEYSEPYADGKQINQTQARNIAVADAGVNENKTSFRKNRNGTEKGVPVYEFEFEDDTAEYKYDIAKQGGEILSYSRTIKTPACTRAAAEKAAGAESQ